MAEQFKLSDMDKEKVKFFFNMLGEVIAMIIGLFSVFKGDSKNETKETKKTFNNSGNNNN